MFTCVFNMFIVRLREWIS